MFSISYILQYHFLLCMYHVFIYFGMATGFIVASAMVGFNYGGSFAVFPAITADYFGNKRLGSNYGWLFTAYGLAGIVGPQLAGLFADGRTPNVIKTYAVYDWDWGTGQQGALLSTWPVTLMGLETSEGELIHLPDRNGGDIYQGRFKAIVIYAENNFITLKYTREDDVVQGYTIHIENVCVDPDLVALYRQGDDEGRTALPALAARQAFGIALGNEIRVAIRDVGTFMDPRSRKDWWVGHELTTPTVTSTQTATTTATITRTPTATSTITRTPTATPTP